MSEQVVSDDLMQRLKIDPKQLLVSLRDLSAIKITEQKLSNKDLSPLKEAAFAKDKNYIQKGIEISSNGRVGVVILAGGDGTRLGLGIPKGLCEVTPVRNKTVFEHLFEKLKAFEDRYSIKVCTAIMTSKSNHRLTENYFENNKFFGIDNVLFFSQKNLPLLDESGKCFIDETKSIASGPDGNGGVFDHFVKNGVFSFFKSQRIEAVNILPIDNPLADPFDPELIGLHFSNSNDVTINAIENTDPKQLMGSLVLNKGQIRIMEYTEGVPCLYSNTGLYCVSMDFIKKAAGVNSEYHIVKKSCLKLFLQDQKIVSKKIIAKRFERFIFDSFSQTEKVGVLCSDKDKCFFPIKNRESLKEIKKAILEYDREIFHNISGIKSKKVFELSKKFYYPSEKLLEKWKDKSLSEEDYIV